MTLYRGNRRIKRPVVNGQPARFLMRQGRQVWPCRKALSLGSLEYRIFDDGSEKWFEVGFDSPEILTGNATDGWTDVRGYVVMRLQHSEDLVSWQDRNFIDCAVTGIANGNGTYRYWARCIFPVDSKVKTGQLWCASGDFFDGGADSRNNPFINLTINNVVRALGGFPYSMPGDASRMQADMITNGLAGATVVATDATTWRIDVPNVHQTVYGAASKVGWPGYLVPDMYGALTITVDGRGFRGQFVNAAGVRTRVLKQFARIAIQRGSRVLP